MSIIHRRRKQYLITEPYDGSHVRILASADTPEKAEAQLQEEANARSKQGYTFFQPVRRIKASIDEAENALDRRLASFETW